MTCQSLKTAGIVIKADHRLLAVLTRPSNLRMQNPTLPPVLNTLREIMIRVLNANPMLTTGGPPEAGWRTPAWLCDKTLNAVEIGDAKILKSGGPLEVPRPAQADHDAAMRRQPEFLDGISAHINAPVPCHPVEYLGSE